MIHAGEKLELEIRSLGSSGEGVGAFDGYVVFVDGALPQEKCLVEITQAKKQYGKGKLLNVLTPSPQREEPPCPVFSRCGGCQIQHLNYGAQAAQKKMRVQSVIEKIAKEPKEKVFDLILSDHPFGYRNKIQLPVVVSGGKVQVGLYEKHSHRLVEISSCPIHHFVGDKALQKLLPLVRQAKAASDLRHILLKTSYAEKRVLCVLVTGGKMRKEVGLLARKIYEEVEEIATVVENVNKEKSNVILSNTYRTLQGEGFILERLLGFEFVVSPASFFQVNPPQAEKLYRYVIEKIRQIGARTVLDAYCGVGTMSLLIAPFVEKVVGVEVVPEAICDAKENAGRNSQNNVEFICAKVEDVILDFMQDVVILNPPRRGVDSMVIASLLERKPSDILYVSCDPATLARDISLLKEGGYVLQGIQPVDMFPQTFHVECIAHLTQKE